MRRLMIVLLMSFSLFFTACENPGALVDEFIPVEQHHWIYQNKIRVSVSIENPAVSYHVYLNLRHTAAYRYSNIYLRIRQINPDKTTKVFRKEYKLANPDGEWLGTGSGNLFSYQLPVYLNFRFPGKGTYIFELEQNMRDNPLKEISDVGLRVEVAGLKKSE
ncbi:MAG: gliding motility lipoprotein GldH [Bacteroidota bacterium]|jgi:gliding motility-associated lipoprotein GldH